MKQAAGLLCALLLAGGAWAQNVASVFGGGAYSGGGRSVPGAGPTFGRAGGRTAPAGRGSGPRNGSYPFGYNYSSGRGFGANASRWGNMGLGLQFAPEVDIYPPPETGAFDAPDLFDSSDMGDPQPQPQSPSQLPPGMVIYGSDPAPPDVAQPLVVQIGPDGTASRLDGGPLPRVYQPPVPPPPAAQAATPAHAPYYLIAFKDHTIFSAVAYWFDGNTLHYFTQGNIHKQAPVALIDRALTERLNRELGSTFQLPPAK